MKCWAQGMQYGIISGTYHLWQAAVFLMALLQLITSYFSNQILSVPISRENIKVLKKHSKKKSIAGGCGRMLETSGLKYLDSLNQRFKSQEDWRSPSSFASQLNSTPCRNIQVHKLLYQWITLPVFRALLLMVLLDCFSGSTQRISLSYDMIFYQA